MPECRGRFQGNRNTPECGVVPHNTVFFDRYPLRTKVSSSERSLRWHCTKSSDCQVSVGGATSNLYGVNVTKAVIGAYM